MRASTLLLVALAAAGAVEGRPVRQDGVSDLAMPASPAAVVNAANPAHRPPAATAVKDAAAPAHRPPAAAAGKAEAAPGADPAHRPPAAVKKQEPTVIEAAKSKEGVAARPTRQAPFVPPPRPVRQAPAAVKKPQVSLAEIAAAPAAAPPVKQAEQTTTAEGLNANPIVNAAKVVEAVAPPKPAGPPKAPPQAPPKAPPKPPQEPPKAPEAPPKAPEAPTEPPAAPAAEQPAAGPVTGPRQALASLFTALANVIRPPTPPGQA